MNNKKQNNKRYDQGITLLETIVTVVIIGVLVAFLIPSFSGTRSDCGYSNKAINSQRQILLGCNTFAADYDGHFPFSFTQDEAMSSQDVFNSLIPEYIDSESIFWIRSNDPAKKNPPVENGKLEANEVSYAYMSQQTVKNRSSSPLISDGEMNKKGEFNKYHPWLKSRKAVVGFVGGHVQEHPLTSNKPGATAKDVGIDSEIKNIFEKRANGGLLDTDAENILLPK